MNALGKERVDIVNVLMVKVSYNSKQWCFNDLTCLDLLRSTVK